MNRLASLNRNIFRTMPTKESLSARIQPRMKSCAAAVKEDIEVNSFSEGTKEKFRLSATICNSDEPISSADLHRFLKKRGISPKAVMIGNSSCGTGLQLTALFEGTTDVSSMVVEELQSHPSIRHAESIRCEDVRAQVYDREVFVTKEQSTASAHIAGIFNQPLN